MDKIISVITSNQLSIFNKTVKNSESINKLYLVTIGIAVYTILNNAEIKRLKAENKKLTKAIEELRTTKGD